MAKKQRHTREYKLQAVQMVLREKRKIVDVAAELGLHEVLLGRWPCHVVNPGVQPRFPLLPPA